MRCLFMESGFVTSSHSQPEIEEHCPTSTGEVSRLLESWHAQGTETISITGGRTSPSHLARTRLSTLELSEVQDYPARDMTITVGAGMRVDDLQAILKKENQSLPIDIPQSHRATLGGAIATNTSGPRRFGYGTLRDYLIGITAVDGRGRIFSAGGRVVKNVAGYDLCKLMIGSRGKLGVITEITLKLRPLAETQQIVWAVFDDLERIDPVLARLNQSMTRPVGIEVLNALAAGQIRSDLHQDLPVGPGVLVILYEGTDQETHWQVQKISQELETATPASIEIWSSERARDLAAVLTEFPVGSDDPLTFQAALLPSRVMSFLQQANELGISTLSHAGNGIVVGHLPDSIKDGAQAAEVLSPLVEILSSDAGDFELLSCDAEWASQIPKISRNPSVSLLAQRIRETFDPAGLFL